MSATVESGDRIEVGTQMREVHRAPGGKELESVVEVSEYEANRVFALRVVEGALPIDGRITVEPAASGTLMSFTAHGQVTGMMRLAEPLLRRTLERQFRRHCTTLKTVLEKATGAA